MDLATGRRELHRFRPGDSCDECNARRWYTDSSLRYCENGHLIESYVPFADEDEGNFGNKGHVARRKKEVREREARQLSGVDARELFLECLQLLLRKQVAWLLQLQAAGAPAESPASANVTAAPVAPVAPPAAALESVVRDLWDLRIRYFHGLTVMSLATDGPRTRRSSHSRSRSRSRSHSRVTGGTTSGSESDGRTIYSSQPEMSDAEGGGYTSGGSRVSVRKAKRRSARKWQSGPDERWNVPPVMETLALCYLGGVLLQLPYRIGDFYRWAKNDQIPFLEAIKHIPKVMRDRLPASYQNALTTKLPSLVGGELHEVVLALVKGFSINNELRFPGLNVPPTLWRWTRDLGLPIDVYAGVLQLSRLSREDYCYPIERTKLFWIDYPDVLLLATVIMVTKLLYPFRDPRESSTAGGAHRSFARYESSDETDSQDNDDDDDDDEQDGGVEAPAVFLDWTKWQSVYGASSKRLAPTQRLNRRQLAKLRTRDAWTLAAGQIDDYLDWHQEFRLTEKEDPRHFLRLFPLGEIQPRPPTVEEPEEDVNARYQLIQETCLVPREPAGGEHLSKKAAGKRPATEHPSRPTPPPPSRLLRKYPLDHYREVSDLPGTAHAFYSRAASLAGVTLQTLVREVSRLERRWKVWDLTKKGQSGRLSSDDKALDEDQEDEATVVVNDDDDDDNGEDDFQRHAHLYVSSSPPG